MPTNETTFINFFGLWFALSMGFLIVVLPRRFALVPVIMLTCFMTMGQRVIVETLDFTMLRILTLFGWARLVVWGELHSLRLNAIDKAILVWTGSSIITYTLLWQTFGALINRLGHAYNAVGMYFLFRFLVRDQEDPKRVFKILAISIVPLAVSMLIEKTTGRNAFAIFGGVPEITMVRDGVVRSQGPFAHPILAGTFGATTAPLFVALWWQGGVNRLFALMGGISSTLITLTAASSGPVFAYLAGLVALGMWPLRKHMRAIRWGLLLMSVTLHLVMKAPAWFLIARVNVFSGSTGWHRAHLIDRAIANLSGWWLIGTKSPGEWGDGLSDVTNQYLVEGVNGGLLTMVLFVAIITLCFRGVGRAIRAFEMEDKLRQVQLCLWGMGAALFTHVTTFLSVSYFDQNFVMWYLLLGMISTISGLFVFSSSLRHSPVPQWQLGQVGAGPPLAEIRERSSTRSAGLVDP